MLYASTKRQIQKAIDHIGVKPGKRNLAAVIVGEDKQQVENQLKTLTECFGSLPDEAVLQLTSEKMLKIQAAFQITQQEMQTQKGSAEKALVNLLIEHMALLATQF
jgi:tRNA threonylcarbamoyladenosine modification (KEOPS) complex Cgi121 subunit